MHRPYRAFAVAIGFAFICFAAKRPLNHGDYDSWKSITSVTLSRDGRYLAYGLFPQEGDGQVVVRDLKTGTETREPAGAQPPPPAPDPESEGQPRPPAVMIRFSRDCKTVVFTTFAAKSENDAARKAKKKPEEMPKGGLVILPLNGGSALRVTHVESFQLPEEGDGWVAYLKQSPSAPPQAQAAPTGRARARTAAPGDLVLRNLGDGTEKTVSDVTEYFLTKDAAVLVYAVNSKTAELSGVYEGAPGGEPKPLLSGKGKYSKLAWDKPQKTLAFLSSRDDADAKSPHLKLYGWHRNEPAARELVTGAPAGYEVSESGTNPVVVSKDGSHVFYSLARSGLPRGAPAADVIPYDKPSFDLWHYKDDYVQPIQKIHAARDRARTYSAVYDFASGKWTQLADESMEQLIPSTPGTWALGSDDRQYRAEAEYGERYRDTYLVDAGTGVRTLVAKRHTGTVTWSADGNYALTFNGKDWSSIEVPHGKAINLTGKLPVKFQNEEHDSPNSPPPYGAGGWTRDGRVLLYDRYDIWSIAPDGSGARNLTESAGRKGHLIFRYVKLDPEEESIDTSKPLLLRAENEDTRESGFYRLDSGGMRKLVMSARDYGQPVKAKDADVFAMTAGSFSEFPDIQVTDGAMREMHRASTANPQKEELSWGTSELVSYVNADGVHLRAALYKPENFDPHKKYPMMVYIYERLSQNVNRFVEPRPMHSINFSYYVSNGYLILTPDIVYTEGYPGESALKCVLPAIQAMVDRGFVDPNAIGIQGHSWGGYQIAYMITQTNRFRAAAAGAPVANMTSAYDGIRWGSGLPRQFQYEKTQSRIGGSLWQYPMRFIENSPLFQADRIRTPLLMIHNDADDAVPWYQGIEFFLALRRLGKEVYMFSYNGEPHHLLRRPNQKDYTMRLQQYFDHYLKGTPAPDWMLHGIPYLDKQAALAATDAQP